METNNSTISINKFILGQGTEGVYSDITIEIKRSGQAKINRGHGIQLNDEKTLKAIENEFEKNWINGYKKDGINLEITILNVGVDPSGRKYAIENSVNRVMHNALPKIGINPPQIFGL